MVGWKDTAEFAAWAWENRDHVKTALAGFRRWFRKSKILIIGPGGTGKSTLARMLSGEYDWLLDSPWEYEESVGVDRSQLKADPAAEVVVLPGQAHRRRTSWAGVGKDLAAGVYHGVLLVSAFGYHSLSESSFKHHDQYEPGQTKEQFFRKYLDAARQDEVGCLKQLVPFLKECPRKLWLLSVVTKPGLVAEPRRQGGSLVS